MVSNQSKNVRNDIYESRDVKNSSIARRDIANKRFSHPIRASYSNYSSSINSWRKRTIFLIIGITLAVSIYYLYYSPYFTVKTIDIPETKYIPQEKLKDTVSSHLDSLRIFPINQKHILFFNTNSLKETLENAFGFENITSLRVFPNTLRLSLTESTSLIIKADPSSDSWNVLTKNGTMVKMLYPFDVNKEIPIIWNDTGKEGSNHALMAIALLQKKSMYETLFKITHFIMKNDTLLDAYTDRGFVIKLNPENSIDQQMTNFQAIIQEFQSKQTLPKEYLLLQYGEKVFYR